MNRNVGAGFVYLSLQRFAQRGPRDPVEVTWGPPQILIIRAVHGD